MMSDNSGEKNKSKVVVITGSSKGIGKAIAKEFAKSGYSLVLNARNKDELEQTTTEITKEFKGNNTRISFIMGDISQEQTCKTLIDEAINNIKENN
jgi:3-oxoacyl-[acyl-carrier protein] reductase